MIRSARFASANKTSHAGTSLSHSIQGGLRAGERPRVERPYGVGDFAPMVVDQERGIVVVAVNGMTAEMNFADMLDGEFVDEGSRIEAVIDGLDVHIVHVEQKPAAGAARNLAQERDLAHRRIGESDIGGGILEQHPAPERLLHLLDMVADARERLLGVGQRQ